MDIFDFFNALWTKVPHKGSVLINKEINVVSLV